MGGLASLVVDALYEAGVHKPLLKIAIPDQFIECGSQAYLYDRYGLSTARICERVSAWIGA
jgi:transketolase